jgi:hypothetical protein
MSSQYALGPLLYAVGLVIAWFNVRASVIANTAPALFCVLPPNMIKKRPSPYR